MNMTGVKGVQEHTRLFRDFRECEKETSTSFAWKDWVCELMGSLLVVAGQEG